jgi:hypothetical protein
MKNITSSVPILPIFGVGNIGASLKAMSRLKRMV